MDGDGVGGLQLAQVLGGVDQHPVVHPHRHGAGARVDGFHDANVPVVGPHPLLAAVPLPDDLVVVFDLHHLVPRAEHPGRALQLGLAFGGGVQKVLQQGVQGLGAAGAHLGGAEHLDVPDGVEAVAAGQPGGDQVADQLLAGLAVRLQEKEVVLPAALLQGASADDVVGVLHDEAAFGLPEDMLEADGGHRPRADHLPQDVAGAHAGQLVGVPHHDDPAVGPQGGQQALEQLDVHHAHLVQDHHVALEQVALVVDEADAAPRIVHLQQPVDGGGLAAGQLAQALGGPAGGGAEGHPLGLAFQHVQHRLDGGGLAGAGPAGEHQAVLGDGLADGLPLLGGVGKALGRLQDLDVLVQVAGGLLVPPGQGGQPGGDGLLGGQQVGQVDVFPGAQGAGFQLPGLQAVLQGGGELFGGLVDESGGRGHQPLPRQAGVAVARVVAQGAQQGRFQPLGAVPLHLVVGGDAVRVAEVQLQRLAAQQVGVGGHRLHRPRPKGPEHLHGPAGPDLELGQVGDQLPHPEHPLELLLDAVGLVRRDALDLGQAGGVVGDDVQSRRAERLDDLAGGGGAHVGQGPAGQKGVHRIDVFRHIGQALGGVELPAVGGVVLVPAPADHALAHVQLPQGAADHRQPALPRQLEHHIAAVAVFKDDVLDGALDLFQLPVLHGRPSFPAGYVVLSIPRTAGGVNPRKKPAAAQAGRAKTDEALC